MAQITIHADPANKEKERFLSDGKNKVMQFEADEELQKLIADVKSFGSVISLSV